MEHCFQQGMISELKIQSQAVELIAFPHTLGGPPHHSCIFCFPNLSVFRLCNRCWNYWENCSWLMFMFLYYLLSMRQVILKSQFSVLWCVLNFDGICCRPYVIMDEYVLTHNVQDWRGWWCIEQSSIRSWSQKLRSKAKNVCFIFY